jgi:synaptotagmin-1
MEDNEDAESTKSEVKLGKLQFSMDYDFQKGEVRCCMHVRYWW